MSNPSKRKGSAAEVAVRDYLRTNGWPHTERLPSDGIHDRGDITGIPDWTIEVKATKDVAAGINQGLAELAVERANAGTRHGLLIVKRRTKGNPADWLAVMRLEDALPLMGGSP